ncbi:unnamed protein product [Cryptosporidium hominis]|uniref:SSM4 like RING finger protein n=1 Tax=Cryptosporidium hominis TaxID=237895 RepID=A0A0S4TC48_CRYHO|nr:hypothetical protein [Cryptosporidium hominis TU502]PPS95136.1 SSM4 like RING finger protein [Cryptosporidium hominis]CUV04597.1 unnamed protein product [Cryptosporidium hominis]|eukprot:PPS95136.1 SSM4 like RING finger protein [Cryptosporidium hominis]
MYMEEGFLNIYNKECRFCFGVETDHSPLITPCECKGTQAYIHLNCLYRWQRLQINRPWSSRFCSVCLHPYSIPRNTHFVFFQGSRIKLFYCGIFSTYIKLIFAVFAIANLQVFSDLSPHLGNLSFFSILGFIFSFFLYYNSRKRIFINNLQADSS